MDSELIVVRQLPVIEDHLRSMKDAVDAKVAEALSLVCCPETIQSVKEVRADMRKQFDILESQRKAVKVSILGPYNQFEAVYRECVSDAFRGADASLKRKIDDVESEIKMRCEDDLKEYFAELCAANHLDFLRYEQTGIKVDMASAKQKTPKKLREQLVQFVTSVSQDVGRIADMDDAEEIMVEYKRTLNAMDAIGTVLDRHRRIDQERAAKEVREAERAAEAKAVKEVEAVARPVHATPREQEPVLTCTFTVHATKEQLKKLKYFLIQEGISYE